MLQTRSSSAFARQRDRGVSLIFALIGLVVLSLAAVALVRSVDTGTQVLGNLGFKQDATKSSDQGAEQAIAWLQGQAAAAGALDNDSAGSAYWASSHDLVDATGQNTANTARIAVDWKGDDCASYPSGTYSGGCLDPRDGADVNGNKTQYMIFRLCPAAGKANSGGNDCSRPVVSSKEDSSITRGELNYRKYERFTDETATGAGVYYRIIVRTVGGRDAVSFTETIVHL